MLIIIQLRGIAWQIKAPFARGHHTTMRSPETREKQKSEGLHCCCCFGFYQISIFLRLSPHLIRGLRIH